MDDFWARLQAVECYLSKMLNGEFIPKPAGCTPGQILYIKSDGCVGCRDAGDEPDPDPTTFVAYWGWRSTSDPLTEGQLQTLNKTGTFPENGNVIANFSEATEPLFLIYAEPSTEPIKTKWKVNDFNNGNIGVGEAWSVAYTAGSLRVYVTSFETEIGIIELQIN